jgi:hypothetical protein
VSKPRPEPKIGLSQTTFGLSQSKIALRQRLYLHNRRSSTCEHTSTYPYT